MYKFKEMILMLCFILSGALCYANGVARTENKKTNEEGISISVKEKASHGGLDKSNTITPTLDDHILTVVFSENLGQVSIEITTSMGGYVQADSCLTPNGIQFYIPLAGDYIVTFTLPNGDDYLFGVGNFDSVYRTPGTLEYAADYYVFQRLGYYYDYYKEGYGIRYIFP